VALSGHGKGTPFVGTEAIDAGTFTERELRRSCTRLYRNVYQRRDNGLAAADRAVAVWARDHRRGIAQAADTDTQAADTDSGTKRVGRCAGADRHGWEQWRVGVAFDGAQHWTDPRIRANDIDRTAELECPGSASRRCPAGFAAGRRSRG
jgi:hypothetical protein